MQPIYIILVNFGKVYKFGEFSEICQIKNPPRLSSIHAWNLELPSKDSPIHSVGHFVKCKAHQKVVTIHVNNSNNLLVSFAFDSSNNVM